MVAYGQPLLMQKRPIKQNVGSFWVEIKTIWKGSPYYFCNFVEALRTKSLEFQHSVHFYFF